VTDKRHLEIYDIRWSKSTEKPKVAEVHIGFGVASHPLGIYTAFSTVFVPVE